MGIPSELYRNAIDLNRYSNQVSRQIVVEYNNIIVQAVNDLKIIGGQSETYKAARLRSILAQLKESLDISIKILNDNKFKNLKIIDLRQKNQVIING